MATFITAQSVGQNINIQGVDTSTGFWKYNHDGSDSSVFNEDSGAQTVTVTNANGEFTIIPCLSDGTVSGDLTYLDLTGNQITSFDGTGLTSLFVLNLQANQLTSFDGTGLTSLVDLYLNSNQITSFDGTGLTSLANLVLGGNQITSLSGFIFPTSLIYLYLNGNQLTSFDGTGLTSLTTLYLQSNQLTSFDSTDLTSLSWLYLNTNQLTSLSGFIFPTSEFGLDLSDNQFTSFDGTGLSSLTDLILHSNQLTSFDGTGLTSLIYLELFNDKYGSNPMTPELNNSILSQLDDNGLSNGQFSTINGRTSDGTADYDALVAKGWTLSGLDLTGGGGGGVNVTGKLRIKGATTVGSGGGLPGSPPQWDGGTIYNIGAVVTHEGQKWDCIQYAPAGYGPFGGYIDVYWTL